jgi:pyruvate kinase
VSDVANAILDGTDAVMLSEETAIGRYPMEAVEMIGKIAISAEREKKAILALADLPVYFRAAVGSGNAAVEDVVTLHAVESAGALNVRYILTHAQGSTSPRLISRFRPECWILAHGGDERTNNFLSLSYGVHPVHLDAPTSGLAGQAARWLLATGLVEKNESLVWVEDDARDDRQEALSMKIIKA